MTSPPWDKNIGNRMSKPWLTYAHSPCSQTEEHEPHLHVAGKPRRRGQLLWCEGNRAQLLRMELEPE